MSSSIAPTGTRVPKFETLPERLTWARDTAPLTQQQMADNLGISKRSVQNYESGAQEPKPSRILLWANACDVDYGWLQTGTYGGVTSPATEEITGGYTALARARRTQSVMASAAA